MLIEEIGYTVGDRMVPSRCRIAQTGRHQLKRSDVGADEITLVDHFNEQRGLFIHQGAEDVCRKFGFRRQRLRFEFTVGNTMALPQFTETLRPVMIVT
ncbi:hypothetical protein SDC9_167448 [bioreactor metagenome]|uniref:Uncharacterized protein n=1 Tax=bioreactor metagenome TaxID=1076179 RepID=A0A645G2A5_9ZZZZ